MPPALSTRRAALSVCDADSNLADGYAEATRNAGPANLDSATGLGPALSSIMRQGTLAWGV